MGSKNTKSKTQGEVKQKPSKEILTRDEMLDKADKIQKEDIDSVKRMQNIVANMQQTYKTKIEYKNDISKTFKPPPPTQ